MIHAYLSWPSRDRTRIEDGRGISCRRCRAKTSLDARHSCRRRDRRSDGNEWKLLSVAHDSWNDHWEETERREGHELYLPRACTKFILCITRIGLIAQFLNCRCRVANWKQLQLFRLVRKRVLFFDVRIIGNLTVDQLNVTRGKENSAFQCN